MRQFILMMAVVLVAATAMAKTVLVPGSDDIPLMPGLEVNADESFVFDTPSGRLVDAFSSSAEIKMQDVKAYYEQSLPQLGWQKIADNFYQRDGEKLKINFDQISGKLIVKFTLAPSNINLGRN